jgi:RNA polymerase sigma-70 factor (ECF subfamily)
MTTKCAGSSEWHAWVLRARADDTKAITQLYRHFWRAARAAAYGVTGDISSAEDAAAEGLQLALARIGRLREPALFAPWMRRIVIRTARRERRKDARFVSRDDLDTVGSGPPGIEEALERHEIALLLRRAVERAPAHLREAISLHYFEGYDVEAAAQFLGIPAGTLKRRLHEGRARLSRAAIAISSGQQPGDVERERLAERVDAWMIGGSPDGFYALLRSAMALRPVPRDLVQSVMQHLAERAAPDEGGERGLSQMFRQSISALDATDEKDARMLTAKAIQAALPDFQQWNPSVEDRIRRLMDRMKDGFATAASSVGPPGFAEGRPGRFWRLGSALVAPDENAELSSVVRESADLKAFSSKLGTCRVSKALDLLWLEAHALHHGEIEELLERLLTAVLPDVAHRITAFSAPRYRIAMKLELSGIHSMAAVGGVLNRWTNQVAGTDAGHLRIHLEPWTTARSGEAFEREDLMTLGKRAF